MPERATGRAARDPARSVAFDLLSAVSSEGAFANLRLPQLLTARRATGRDAALATELGYGAVRSTGTLDAILTACSSRPLDQVDGGVLDLLRLGAYQLLRTRIPPHAAVAATVELSRDVGVGRASGFINAVLRKVTRRDWDGWAQALATSDLERLALRTAHPAWIAAAFTDALGGDATATAQALEADDTRPVTHLVAYPGLAEPAELPGQAGPWSPYAVRMAGGDPSDVAAVRDHRAGVQDEGSQLCALALARAPLTGPDERWLDLCAGPGGKTALLAALAAQHGAALSANELRPHRAELVRQATARWKVPVRVGDARDLPETGFDRVLVDAPCTGLGALRRRPEARWRRDPGDVPQLADLQRDLVAAALERVRPGGVVAYVVCSPHLAETRDVVAGRTLLDARPLFEPVPDLGEGPTVQLWPHRHGTDAMFCALIQRPL